MGFDLADELTYCVDVFHWNPFALEKTPLSQHLAVGILAFDTVDPLVMQKHVAFFVDGFNPIDYLGAGHE